MAKKIEYVPLLEACDAGANAGYGEVSQDELNKYRTIQRSRSSGYTGFSSHDVAIWVLSSDGWSNSHLQFTNTMTHDSYLYKNKGLLSRTLTCYETNNAWPQYTLKVKNIYAKAKIYKEDGSLYAVIKSESLLKPKWTITKFDGEEIIVKYASTWTSTIVFWQDGTKILEHHLSATGSRCIISIDEKQPAFLLLCALWFDIYTSSTAHL